MSANRFAWEYRNIGTFLPARLFTRAYIYHTTLWLVAIKIRRWHHLLASLHVLILSLSRGIIYMMTSSNGNILPRYWPFVRGIHQSPVNSLHQGQWRGLWCFLWSAVDKRLGKRLGKQSWGWWFETPSRSLWRHCNDKYELGISTNLYSMSLRWNEEQLVCETSPRFPMMGYVFGPGGRFRGKERNHSERRNTTKNTKRTLVLGKNSVTETAETIWKSSCMKLLSSANWGWDKLVPIYTNYFRFFSWMKMVLFWL